MDTNITFGKQKFVSISRSLAFFLCLLFVGCMVGTGLLVYNFTSCGSTEEEVVVYEKTFTFDSTTIGTTDFVTTTERNQEIEDVRLPTNIIPDFYDIKLVPFIIEGNFTFNGEVGITVNVTEASNSITLHASDLFIKKIEIRGIPSNEKLGIVSVTNNTKKQFITITTEEFLELHLQYLVKIEFSGVLNNFLQGFYRSSYKINNETRWIAATQFQATDARKAFPCFDEPALKAKFKISLARLHNMTAISNMPKVGSPEPVGHLSGYFWDHFEASVPMSTYLVAFVVSDFGHISQGILAVYARKGALSQASLALQAAPTILTFYEKFFGVRYPLPKLDMVALPDFSAGAMENWGLLTYRESVLLYEEGISSKGSRQRIAHVVAHELAHQWFGNLVTPIWWTDLWLNEGFATYMESLGADAVNPHLKEQDQFVINELHPALTLDGLKSSHPISIKVNNPDEINDIFDRISYSKGAAILRMMQHFLSMEVFQKGITRYLKNRMYKNAEQDDLWYTLTLQSQEDGILELDETIKEIMDTWTLQTGFPVITVQRDYQNSHIIFTQERFLLDRDLSNDLSLWWVPISYGTLANTSFIWLKKEPTVTVIDLSLKPNDWLLVNLNQTGYYRVNYDLVNWDLITTQLLKPGGHRVFDAKNRAQLVDDSFNLASVGYLSYNITLNVTKYLRQEREYVPWKAALTNLDYLNEMFIRTAHFDKFKAYLISLLKDYYEEIGFNEKEGEPDLVAYSRYEIITKMCMLGLRDCVINSVRDFQTWRNSPDPDKRNLISENLREIVYCTAISVGGQEEWDFAWERYLNANVETERETLLMALGCSKEIWLLSRYLEWAVDDQSGIRKHDSARVFAAVSTNPIGQQLAYRFLKTNWNKLRTYLGISSMSLSNIVRSSTIKFNTRLEVDDFKNFLKSREADFGVALRTAHQSIEQGEANIKWMEKNSNDIIAWLSANI